jgi:hypothetical protein
MAAIPTRRAAFWRTTVIWAAAAVVLALASTGGFWRTLRSFGPVPCVSLNTPIVLFCDSDPFCLSSPGQELSHESPIHLDWDVDRKDVLKVYPAKFTVDWDGGLRYSNTAEYLYENCSTSALTTCVVGEAFMDCTCTWDKFSRGFGFGFDEFSPIDPVLQPQNSLKHSGRPYRHRKCYHFSRRGEDTSWSDRCS